MGRLFAVPSWIVRAMGLLLIAVALAGALHAGRVAAQAPIDLTKPVMLVTTAQVMGYYEASVMVAVPLMGGHVGFVVNKPSKVRMIDAYPDFEPGRRVEQPLYRGGRNMDDMLFAVVRAPKGRDHRSIELLPGVWMETSGSSIDAVIAETPNDARYFIGCVTWMPGQLLMEIRDGTLLLRPVRPEVFFLKDPSGLYRELQPGVRVPKGARQT